MRRILLVLYITGCGLGQSLQAQPFTVNDTSPALELYMYAGAFSTNADRIPVWAYYAPDSGVDTRMSQSIVGWQTASLIPTNQTPTHYLIKRCRVTLTINDNNTFLFDPTHDAYQTHLDTSHPSYQPDTDIGRTVELFGVGYRNGYDAISFSQAPAFGSGAPGGRNAYAAGWGTNGGFVDVSNNFGKTNDNFPFFEAWPFAIGQVTNVAPGQLVPVASKMFFELDVLDPAVITYLQNGLDIGVLNFAVSTLYPVTGYSGPGGMSTYPAFITRFNQAVLDPPTTMDLEVTVVRDIDTDDDGLPDDWEQFYFTNLVQTAEVDFDGDGASNQQELLAGTNPALASSVLKIASNTSGDGRTVLSWPNLPSRTFTVEHSGDLGDWQVVESPTLIFNAPSAAEWTDTDAVGTNRFYRVKAVAE